MEKREIMEGGKKKGTSLKTIVPKRKIPENPISGHEIRDIPAVSSPAVHSWQALGTACSRSPADTPVMKKCGRWAS